MVAVIGDIHGCLHTLQKLYLTIREKYPTIEIYSVGDLVDRGNFSFEVVEFVKTNGIKFTPGNHDYMMYYFIKHPTHRIGRPWLNNGYEPTLTSYSEHFDKLNEHLELIIKQPLFYNLSDCFISHAGIAERMKYFLPHNFSNIGFNLSEVIKSFIDDKEGILWTRSILLNVGKLQIVGHTRKKEVFFDEKSNSAYIDTGVYTGNKLSAVIVDSNMVTDVLTENTHDADIAVNY
ncbi:MAG: metallophosphoesterase [Ignavibacteriaceae bacterium]|nr:metallophosphoesterase [Ignavibacteriaceae bacterium]